MKITSTSDLGKFSKEKRKSLGLTQSELALASGVGVRFIVEFENGKETAQIGKVLKILNSLGIEFEVVDLWKNPFLFGFMEN